MIPEYYKGNLIPPAVLNINLYTHFIKHNFNALHLGKKKMKTCLWWSHHLGRPLEHCLRQLKGGDDFTKTTLQLGHCSSPLPLRSSRATATAAKCLQHTSTSVFTAIIQTVRAPHLRLQKLFKSENYLKKEVALESMGITERNMSSRRPISSC